MLLTEKKVGSEAVAFSIIPQKEKYLHDDESVDVNAESLESLACFDCTTHDRKAFGKDSSADKTQNFLSWPPQGKISQILAWILVIPVIWGVAYSLTSEEALPGGNLFSIAMVLILSQIGGVLASRVRLPPLLGMLVVGIALRSLPVLDIIGTNVEPKWSSSLRKMALVIILTRAGLGLDPKALRQLSFLVIRLGILPNLAEMAVVTVVSKYLLAFPWLWSIMLGFILSGVSPSVVVPCMLTLSDRGYGVEKGVPTLVIAGLSVDNVLSITGFGVVLGVIFSDGSIMWQAFKGPIEMLMGFCFGVLFGSLLWYIPNIKTKGASKLRLVLLLGLNLLAIFGSVKVGFGGAGPLGCLCTSFVAGIGWRKQGWNDKNHPVKKSLNFLWQFFLPLLFGLIGTEIKISALDVNTVGIGCVILAAGLSFRLVISYFCVLGGDLDLKERIFVALAWLPKATVQAAVGSTALDMARALNHTDTTSYEELLGQQVLTIAVLVILIAAPIGAAAIMLSAPKLLKRKLSEVELQDIA